MNPLLAAALPLALLAPPELAGAPPPAPGDEAEAPAPQRYLVERVAFEGLDSSSEAQVRRYLLVSEGDLLDDERVLLSALRLRQLGWFSQVDTRVERGSARGRVVLVFTFKERNTLLVSELNLGSTPPQSLYGGFGLSQQNFLGRGLGLSGAFVYGGSLLGMAGERYSLRGAFFAPDLRVARLPPVVAGLTAIWIRGQELACADRECSAYASDYGAAPRLRYTRAGGEVSFGIRPGPFERLILGYRFERVAADVPATPEAPAVRPGVSRISALTGLYERDTRDDPFFPTAGSRLLGQITFASRALGGDYDYSRYLLQLEVDVGLPRGHALRLSAVAGAVQGDAPFFDRFYAADHTYFSLGPALARALEVNFSTDSRYDELLAAGGAEYGIPLWRRGTFFHRGYLALGVRALWSAAEPERGRTRLSDTPFAADAALRFDTPVGTFNFSLAYFLDVFL